MSKTAYPSITEPVSITLYCNIPFDNTYTHHSLISELFKYNNTQIYHKPLSPATYPCEEFIDRRDYSKVGRPYVYPHWTLNDAFNFDFKNGILGDVYLELTNAQTNANYLKVDCRGVRWYYFITGITQSNNGTYKLSLELDVLMTYQDEFLNGIKNYPVFTKRKHSHRYTNDGLMPYCSDFKNGEDAFANVKPTQLTKLERLTFENSDMKKLAGIMWLYVCVDTTKIGDTGDPFVLSSGLDNILYGCRGKKYPLIMCALPINVNRITYQGAGGLYPLSYSRDDIVLGIKKLINNGSIHGAKLSPYPPFALRRYGAGSITFVGNQLTISGNVDEHVEGDTETLATIEVGDSKILYGKTTKTTIPDSWPLLATLLFKCGFCVVIDQNEVRYNYEDLTPTILDVKNNTAPTINSSRYKDPKLLFSPFRKYKINAQYSSEGFEFYPELVYSEYYTTINNGGLSTYTIATAYIGDNNFYTEISDYKGAFDNYMYEKIGFSSSVNYIMPCGENALDVFNSTSAQTFYQSKTASGITSGLTIAGGVGSVGLGIAGAVGSLGLSAPMSIGLIASGSTAIASGVASLSNSILSTQAKIEDLKNTPDSINISGSNFVTDDCLSGTSAGLPYLVIYDVSTSIKNNADEYFYAYGYQVSRQCYFNLSLDYDNSTNHKVDDNLFGRTIFNYIQIQEDITNKIDADIPYIVKKKLSNIFNQGITLWSFFGLKGLWNTTNPTSQDYVDNWFFKNELDNTEYNG